MHTCDNKETAMNLESPPVTSHLAAPAPTQVTPELLAQHSITAQRVRAHSRRPRPRPKPHRTRHLQRHVERALLLQVLARPPQAPADQERPRRAGAGRKRRHHRRRRRLGLRLQDRVAQPPLVHRALPGRGHRSRRHSPRHLHHERAPARGDGFAALRADLR